MAINSSGDITLEGTLTAENYVVSSSVTNQTIAGVSGSTSFGDDTTDNHQFTGSLIVSGGLKVIGNTGLGDDASKALDLTFDGDDGLAVNSTNSKSNI